jgi:DNA-binding transcriptional regulator LsrR (DeoR family)
MKDSSETGLRNDVLHRHHQGESQRRITRQLDVSRWKVAEIVAGFERV